MRRLLSFLLLLLPALATAEIGYRITVDPPARSIRVAIQADDLGDAPTFRIPAWCPGFYFLQDYPAKLSDVRATDAAGRPLSIARDGKYGWTVANPSKGPVTLSYSVLGDDGGLGFFGVSVHPHTAFINGPAAMMYVDGKKTEPTTLELRLPTDWEVATTMRQDDQRWRADDYDELIDHPIQVGKFQRRRFAAAGIPFEAVFVSESGRFNVSMDREVQVMKAVSEASIKLFGKAPFKKYMYLVHLSRGSFDGGLEHRACNVINTADARELGIADLYTHEFLHAWNVKQMRPKVLGPFDYTQPCRTGLLWFFEGVTDYYAYRCTFQARQLAPNAMLDTFAYSIADLEGSSRRKSLTLEDVSRQTWENGGFGVGDYSYYTGGLVAGLLLDVKLRSQSQGSKSLDDVMRDLFARFQLPGPGMEEDEIRSTLVRIGGGEMAGLYDRVARSTQPLPIELFDLIGMQYLRPQETYLDLGYAIEDNMVTDLEKEIEALGLKDGDQIITVQERPFGDEAFAGVRGDYTMRVRRGASETTLELRPVQRRATAPMLRINPFAPVAFRRLGTAYLALKA
ncbi:MAG: hypothetical protein HONBIEJF_00138 [Fimbriimonadaceae bacterium]|nr:hypothetical protein [Fimbriimonadaceae bacterium]